LFWLGSTAAEREAIFYDFSTSDHPAFGLNEEPKRLMAGHLNLVGITRKIVSKLAKKVAKIRNNCAQNSAETVKEVFVLIWLNNNL